MTEPILTTYEELKKDLVVVSEDLTEEQRRSELVARLKEGINRTVLGESLLFKLFPDRPNNKTILNDLAVIDSQKRLLAKLFVDINGKKVIRFEKHYEHVENWKLRGVGIITLASGLLFQALIEREVEEVHGIILPSNRSSFASRLKIEDLVRGGYFDTMVSNQRDSKGYYQVVSYIDPKLPRLSQPLSLAEAQLNQISSAPEFALY